MHAAVALVAHEGRSGASELVVAVRPADRLHPAGAIARVVGRLQSLAFAQPRLQLLQLRLFASHLGQGKGIGCSGHAAVVEMVLRCQCGDVVCVP